MLKKLSCYSSAYDFKILSLLTVYLLLIVVHERLQSLNP